MTLTRTKYEAVIGLETHVQLSTESKMFCSCSADYTQAEPNTLVCPVCMGLPGAMPVVNRRAVENAMLIGLALGCEVAQTTKFDRKNYIYSDLMKGYQISQYDMPICFDGELRLNTDPACTVRIERVHMEEDVAKLTHIDAFESGRAYSLLDLNRSGLPLIEVVTRPDMRTSDQVVTYIETLQAIVRFLGVSDANMEEGSFRCDANISLRPAGSSILNPKVEVKNMNRVSAVAEAVEKEIERQTEIYENDGRVEMETRGWDAVAGDTVTQRSKENANDYRYLPEPDIPALSVSREWVGEVQKRMPELPAERKRRIIDELLLSEYDATIIVATRPGSDYFDGVIAHIKATVPQKDLPAAAKNAANWLNTEMARIVSSLSLDSPADTKAAPKAFAVLAEMFRRRELTNAAAKQVLEVLAKDGGDPADVVKDKGLAKVGDSDQLREAVLQAIEDNPKAIDDYMKGKETAAKFLVGQVMKATRGRADAQTAMRLVEQSLTEMKQS